MTLGKNIVSNNYSEIISIVSEWSSVFLFSIYPNYLSANDIELRSHALVVYM